MNAIGQDIQDINATIKVLGRRIDEEERKNLEYRRSALEDFQKLCEASVAAVQKKARYKSRYGDMTTEESSIFFAGVVTKELRGGVDQKFGNCGVGIRSTAFIGAGDTDAVLGFFGQATKLNK